MSSTDPLMVGMFWGGLIVSSVPILMSLGIGIYILRRHLNAERLRRKLDD